MPPTSGATGRPAFRDVTNTSVLPGGVVKRGPAKVGASASAAAPVLIPAARTANVGKASALDQLRRYQSMPVVALPVEDADSVEIVVPRAPSAQQQQPNVFERLNQNITVSAAQKRKRPLAAAAAAAAPAGLAVAATEMGWEPAKRRSVETATARAPALAMAAAATAEAADENAPANVSMSSASPVAFLACAPRYVQAGLSTAPRDYAALPRTATPTMLGQARQAPSVMLSVPKSPKAVAAAAAVAALHPGSPELEADIQRPIASGAYNVLAAERDELSERLEAVRDENTRLTATIRGLEEKAVLQQSLITSFEEEVATLESTVRATEAHIETLEARGTESQQAVAEVTASLAVSEDEVGQLRQALADALAENQQLHARAASLSNVASAAVAYSLLYHIGEIERAQDASASFAEAVAKRHTAYTRRTDGVPSVVRPGWNVGPTAPARSAAAIAPATASNAFALRQITRRRARRTAVLSAPIASPHSPPSAGSAGSAALAAADESTQGVAVAAPAVELDDFAVTVATDSRDEALKRAQYVAKAMKFNSELVGQQLKQNYAKYKRDMAVLEKENSELKTQAKRAAAAHMEMMRATMVRLQQQMAEGLGKAMARSAQLEQELARERMERLHLQAIQPRAVQQQQELAIEVEAVAIEAAPETEVIVAEAEMETEQASQMEAIEAAPETEANEAASLMEAEAASRMEAEPASQMEAETEAEPASQMEVIQAEIESEVVEAEVEAFEAAVESEVVEAEVGAFEAASQMEAVEAEVEAEVEAIEVASQTEADMEAEPASQMEVIESEVVEAEAEEVVEAEAEEVIEAEAEVAEAETEVIEAEAEQQAIDEILPAAASDPDTAATEDKMSSQASPSDIASVNDDGDDDGAASSDGEQPAFWSTSS